MGPQKPWLGVRRWYVGKVVCRASLLVITLTVPNSTNATLYIHQAGSAGDWRIAIAVEPRKRCMVNVGGGATSTSRIGGSMLE